jgi:ubiquinone/menaquinone biosynthesis C-methylase UbiE
VNKFDEIAKRWDAEQSRINLAKNIFKAIRKNIPLDSKMDIADIGAGTGLLMMQFVPFVKSITGYDNSEGMLKELEEKIKIQKCKHCELKNFDANTDELPKNSYDLIISSMTFHHISDIERFAKTMYHSLKTGGKFAIGDLETEDGSFHNSEASVEHRGFDLEAFIKQFKKAGFTEAKAERIFVSKKNGKEFPIFLAYGEK